MRRNLMRVLVGVPIAVLVIALDKFVFFDTQEMFDGAARLGDVFYWLAIAYLSSAFFFYLVVYVPWKENERLIYARVGPLASQVRGAFVRTVDELVRQSKMPEPLPSVPLSREEMEAVCDRVSPNQESNMVKTGPPDFIRCTVFEYMIDGYAVTEEKIDQILELAPFLDVDLIGLLNGIRQTSYWMTLGALRFRQPIANTDLAVFCADLLEYQDAAMRLSMYLDERSEQYIVRG